MSILKGRNVFKESNIDSYVRKTHRLLSIIADEISKKKYRWIEKIYDGEHGLSLDKGLLVKNCGLFGSDYGDDESNSPLYVSFYDGRYILHVITTVPGDKGVVRIVLEEYIQKLFSVWGFNDDCIKTLKKSKMITFPEEEEYDREFAVLRRCDTKTQFIEESTLYFPNDYQAEECWKQCKDALWYENNYDDDEYDYCQDFMKEYYYAMFLERDDYDNKIYEEYEDRSSRIFSKCIVLRCENGL